MLFLVEMDVRLPSTMPEAEAEDLKERERAYSQQLQRAGAWRHIWRIAGRYANVSVFDVASAEELHELISGLPLFPYMDINVTALAQHPSAIERSES